MSYARQELGADAAPATMSLSSAISSPSVKTVSGIALVYHGYKRTGSIFGALIYGLAGRLVPVVAVPVAMAQGFGEKKACP